jgi:lipoprotein-anchoring transpeptidase ErfK/SrfK
MKTMCGAIVLMMIAGAAAADPAPGAATAPAVAPVQTAGAPSKTTLDAVNAATLADTGARGGVSPAILRAEVMLDRLHMSPGVIDGKAGDNFQHAVTTYAKTRDLKAKSLDAAVWARLVAESGGPVLQNYVLTETDVAGPFYPDIPADYAKQAEMKTLGYRSPAQKIGAKFHLGEDLLAALNPGVDLGKAGSTILATLVKPEPIHGKLKSIVVDKTRRQVLGYDRRGHILVAYPATIGSVALPSPSGSYRVKGIAKNPVYYYDPKNFLQGDNHDKLRLPPGPNNPVGSVFIALTKPTYGLHGTPDPSKIDKTASHGCVRMTNWDAQELAGLVTRGDLVRFKK